MATEYMVRCRRWRHDANGKKVWETISLHAVNKAQARSFYDDIKKHPSALEDPQIMSRTVTKWVKVVIA